MSDDAKTATIEPETLPKEPRFYGKTKRALDLVTEHGVDPKDALILATGNQNVTSGAVSHFREKVRKYSLSRPAMVKMAHQAIKETLAMKPVDIGDGKQMFPSHTNRLAAAAMVADRAEPIVRANLNINADVEAPIDLDALKGLFNRS